MAQLTLPQDQVVTEQNFTRGLVRDTEDIPPGGLDEVVDLFVERNGLLYKRGGWARHSAPLGGASCLWCGALNVPSKFAAIDSNNTLYDVTDAGTAVSIASVGFAPKEHSSQYINMIVLCDPTGVNLPKKVFYNTGLGRLDIAQFGGVDTIPVPPAIDPLRYAFSTVYSGRVVLGRGPIADLFQRIHFSELPDVESPWDPLKYIDTSYDITGLAAIGGVLLIFSAQHVERILGGVPPAEEGSDMQLQPVAGVGCLDARSIVTWDNSVIFAGEEGVWSTNGSGVDSLIEKPDGTGIARLWRGLFPRGQKRQIVSGLFNRDFYIVHILDGSNQRVETFMCYLPLRAWTRLDNIFSNMMTQGRTAQGVLELMSASSFYPYMDRYTDILNPGPQNAIDGNGTPVSPRFVTRDIDGDTRGLKAYGFGRASYRLDVDFPEWQPNFAYPLNYLINNNNYVWQVKTAGTSSPVRPIMVPGPGDVVDNTVVWTEVTPKIVVTKIWALGQDNALFSRDLRIVTSGVRSHHVNRDRFELFGDYQSICLSFVQQGPTARTEFRSIEVEMRPYPPFADFNTGPLSGNIPFPQ